MKNVVEFLKHEHPAFQTLLAALMAAAYVAMAVAFAVYATGSH